MTTFENPEIHAIYLDDLGTIWEAARVANVKPGTIRVWETRRKIERVAIPHGEPLYHLPTIKAASEVRAGRPARAA